MRCAPRTLVCALVCALVSHARAHSSSHNNATAPCNVTAAATAVSIECCALWSTLSEYIQTHSGVDRSSCDPADCIQRGQIQVFLSETNAVIATKLRVEGSSIVFPLATADEMQRLLVWSLLGRRVRERQERESARERLERESASVRARESARSVRARESAGSVRARA